MADTELLQGGAERGATDPAEGARSLERARKLVALDRALIEMGEPGVLEREPADLVSLETRLFGPPAGASPDAGQSAEAPPLPEEPPASGLRLICGGLETAPEADPGRRAALRAKLRLLKRRAPARTSKG